MTDNLTRSEKLKIVDNITDAQVFDYAKKIADSGVSNYPPGKFRERFGRDCFLLASVGHPRLAPILREEGFEISLKLFPEGEGCQVHERID